MAIWVKSHMGMTGSPGRTPASNRFLLAHDPNVDEHVALLDHLLALFSGKDVRRLGAEYAGEVALAGADSDALGKHDLFPPATERLELEKAFVGDERNHEADFVKVTGDQHTRSIVVRRVCRDLRPR